MPLRFNPPPNWPRPPDGWVPDQGWRPDPAWGPPPPGWAFWVEAPVVRLPGPMAPVRSGGPGVFISYRRSDCQPQANGLYDGLSHRLPAASIFMDIDSIPPGADFEQHIRSEIEICDLLLVLIGDNWLDTPDPGAGRRIDASDDFVRLEIESALASPQVRVLPVLVEGAAMPRAVDLPPSIRSLARLNAVELDDRRWTGDIGRLTATIEELTGATVTRSGSTAAPTGDGEAAPDVDVSGPAPPVRTSAIGWLMVFLPLLTAGLANFAPAVWASRRRPERRARRQLLVFAIVVGLVTFTMLGVIAATPSETVSTIAVLLWWLCTAVAIVVAVVNRKSAVDRPGGAEELQRRRRRAQYRALAQRDPALARQLGVGRPDLARAQDDGGLLDLNALPADALAHWGAIAVEDARHIVSTRQYRSRLSGLVDLEGAGLSAATLARLRETAVFL